jgi:hypothetical protein
MTYVDQHGFERLQPDDPGLYARDAAGSFVQQLEEAVRDNPVPAALIGMGFLWMFMGGSRISLFGGNRGLTASASRATGQAAGGFYELGQRSGSPLARAASGAGAVLSEVGARAGDITRSAAAAVGDAASATTSRFGDAATSAYESAGSAAARGAEAVPDLAASAAQTVQRTGSEWGRSAQQSMADLFERQPLLVGAVGLAIGAGIAASLPLTEAETRFMGKASETLREKAQDFVADTAKQAKAMAERGLQEAETQGLNPRAAGEALRGLVDKVTGVAEAAGGSVQEQVRSATGGSGGGGGSPSRG